jgi:catechol-2,3-dioxygenase
MWDDFMKIRDFYARGIALTSTDEDLTRGDCFLTTVSEPEHYELNCRQSRDPEHPDSAGPRSQGLGQVSFIVSSPDELRALQWRCQAEGTRMLGTVTHGILVRIYLLDPEDNWYTEGGER